MINRKELYYDEIRLLTQSAEKQGPVYLTFRGAFLVGAVMQKDGRWIGVGSKGKRSKDWNREGEWVICQAESGKPVVYYISDGASREDSGGKVIVYANWQELDGHVPPDLIEEAKRKAGILEPPNIPEIPLTEAG